MITIPLCCPAVLDGSLWYLPHLTFDVTKGAGLGQVGTSPWQSAGGEESAAKEESGDRCRKVGTMISVAL